MRATGKEYKSTKKALDQIVDDLEKNAQQAITYVREALKNDQLDQEALIETDKAINRNFEVRFNKVTWKISVELSYDPSLKDLLEVGDHLITERTKETSIRQIGIRLSLTHPFMVQFVGVDNSKIELVLRMAAALGLSEVIAKESGAKTQGEIRRNFNELISCLSKTE